MIPNGSNGNKPIDVLAVIKERKLTDTYLLSGNYLTPFSIEKLKN